MSPRRAPSAALLAALAVATCPAYAEDFSYLPPGDLITGSGDGRVDETIYAPGMRFPVEEAPAFANSQVYNAGGSLGPPGGQCDATNYDYPWRDNYCEIRQWDMPLCPAGTGHQGQDLRPATCQKGVHWAVAAASGTITSIGSYSVYLTGADGTRYDYLHMSDVQVAVGQDVTRGERIGMVSNDFGGTPTTIHLHFNLRQNISGVGSVYVPPYTSLVAAYEELIDTPAEGRLEAADCGGIQGWTRDPDAPDSPGEALLTFDGALGEVDAYSIPADRHRDDLCQPLGSCAHGFSVAPPLSLLGSGEHAVRAYGADGTGGPAAELQDSPASFDCPLDLPTGVRRRVLDTASMDAWRFSSFWDVARADDAAIEALPRGDDLPAAPSLAQSNNGSTEVWLLDGAIRRQVPGPEVAAAWDLDFGAIEILPSPEILALPVGPPLRPRPFLVQDAGPEIYLIDDPVGGGGPSGLGAGEGGEGALGIGEGGLEGQVRCACRAAGSSGEAAPGALAAAALGAAALGRRRRRR